MEKYEIENNTALSLFREKAMELGPGLKYTKATEAMTSEMEMRCRAVTNS